MILAATNRPESLDPALTRPGRFDRRVTVELPDLAGREAILKVHAKKIKMADDVDLHTIARMAAGASGAELANIINEAALRAVRNSIRKPERFLKTTRKNSMNLQSIFMRKKRSRETSS